MNSFNLDLSTFCQSAGTQIANESLQKLSPAHIRITCLCAVCSFWSRLQGPACQTSCLLTWPCWKPAEAGICPCAQTSTPQIRLGLYILFFEKRDG